MNKIYRYPYKVGYPAIAVFAIFIGLIFYGFFMDAYLSKNIVYILVLLIIFAGPFWFLFEGLRNYMSKLIINDELLLLKKPLNNQIVIPWNEINEFGRYKVSGPYTNRWSFYVKTMKTGDKKIQLFSEMIVNGEDLVATIFLKAVNAQFVVIRNISSIPFIKKTIVGNWNEAKDIN